MTIREMMEADAKAKAAAAPPEEPAKRKGFIVRNTGGETGDHPDGPAAKPAPEPPVWAGVGTGYLGRQDQTEPLPATWPPDERYCAKREDLVIVQNPHLESFLAISRPGEAPIYLVGPFRTLNIPY